MRPENVIVASEGFHSAPRLVYIWGAKKRGYRCVYAGECFSGISVALDA